MPNPFSKAIGVALNAASRATATTVTYRRAASFVVLEVGVGATLFESESSDGSLINTQESKDLIISPLALLDFGAGPVEPAAGDTFEIIDELGKILTYEVAAPQGEQAWRYSDPFRTGYRIHSVKTSEV